MVSLQIFILEQYFYHGIFFFFTNQLCACYILNVLNIYHSKHSEHVIIITFEKTKKSCLDLCTVYYIMGAIIAHKHDILFEVKNQ